MGHLAQHAVVIGAGMAGCLAAAALSRHFSRVSLLERDDVSEDDAQHRPGLPQAKHGHVMLRGGLDAMERLLPGLSERLLAHGAVSLQPGKDLLSVSPKGPLPLRAVGPTVLAQSRLLLDRTLRAQLQTLPNVRVVAGSRAEGLLGDAGNVSAVRLRTAAGDALLSADFFIDASGRSAHCLGWLRELGVTPPAETRVRRELRYATRILRPAAAQATGTGIGIFPTRENRRGALLLPIEDARWLLTLIAPPALAPNDDASFERFVAELPSAHVAERIAGARYESAVARFGFDGSCHRHFERLTCWPRNMICIGDAICAFNPVYGQGMSVAALEADALGALLEARSAADWQLGLAADFFAKSAEIIATPWVLSTYPDLAEPDSEGTRPADFEREIGQQRALARLAVQDAEVHGQHLEALHLVRPWASLLAPPLGERVAAALRAQRDRLAS